MVGIGLIGVGYWGPNLLRNLIHHPQFELRRVVDRSIDRQAYVKTQCPTVDVSGECDDVFNDPSIQAVVIATPVKSHFELALKALSAGKHILVEKPMATQMTEIETIQRLAQQHQLVAMSGHTFLFNNAVRYVKSLIDTNELGDLRYIYSQRLNLGRIRSDVDALWNFAPHDISIIQYWLNDSQPSTVQKTGMSYIQDGIDDVVFLNITYPNKVLANIHVSWLDPQKTRKITIVGSKKMVVYNDISDDKITLYDKGIDQKAILGEKMDYDEPNFQFQYRSGDVEVPKIDFIEPLKQEIQHFYDCITTNIPCITGIEHTKKVIGILSQVQDHSPAHRGENRSERNGRP